LSHLERAGFFALNSVQCIGDIFAEGRLTGPRTSVIIVVLDEYPCNLLK